ncbi:hypothetical protein [Sorangium sp. So ce394]|uniref:hypothetical protein n=1 Tax=Sorangium sp. So ce394 TaxID=3133310 RepID=UPI003F5C1C13
MKRAFLGFSSSLLVLSLSTSPRAADDLKPLIASYAKQVSRARQAYSLVQLGAHEAVCTDALAEVASAEAHGMAVRKAANTQPAPIKEEVYRMIAGHDDTIRNMRSGLSICKAASRAFGIEDSRPVGGGHGGQNGATKDAPQRGPGLGGSGSHHERTLDSAYLIEVRGEAFRRFFLETESGRRVQVKPELYREFIERQLGDDKADILGETPIDVAAGDIDELFGRALSSPEVFKKFASWFPLEESSLLLSMAAQDEKPDPASASELDQLKKAFDEEGRERIKQAQILGVSEADFALFDRSLSGLRWLKTMSSQGDASLSAYREALDGVSLKIQVKRPGGDGFLMLRPETKVRIDGGALDIAQNRLDPGKFGKIELSLPGSR